MAGPTPGPDAPPGSPPGYPQALEARLRTPLPAVTLLWLGALAGCEPAIETTGPDGMVGRVLAPDGAPVPGLTVESVETPRKTDGDGRFAVPYQAPNRHVHFRIGQVWFQRQYMEPDQGQIVEIRLPEARNVELSCGAHQGDLTLTWALGSGFKAEVHPRCSPGTTVSLSHIPTGTPVLTTRDQESPTLADRGSEMAVEPPLRPIRVEVQAEGALPEGCEVQVGDRPARPAGEGFWSGEIAGPTTVSAVCVERPARPLLASPEAGTVTVEWSPEGPSLDLVELAPWAHTVTLSRLEGPAWTLRLRAGDDGRYLLPVLGAGTYAVRVEGAESGGGDQAPEPPSGPPGTLVLAPVEGVEVLVGRLQLHADLADGAVRVEGARPPPIPPL